MFGLSEFESRAKSARNVASQSSIDSSWLLVACTVLACAIGASLTVIKIYSVPQWRSATMDTTGRLLSH